MPGKEKENTPLRQASLNFGAGPTGPVAKATTALKGKKRTLAVTNDLSINLNDADIPVTKAIVEAMRKRILELEEQLEGKPDAKRPKLSTTNAGPKERPEAGPGTSEQSKSQRPKTDPKKIDAIIKKIWSSLQKEAKREKHKFRGGPAKTVRIEEVIEFDEFTEIFICRPAFIRVIQPTPENKPNSTVRIQQYPPEEIEKIFGKHYKELKGYRFSRSGIYARYAKGEKIGLVELSINYLTVTYSENTMKCGMKFEVEEAHPSRCGLDDAGNDVDAYIYNVMLGLK